ncbi:MAG: proline dehydrogenase family protein [Gemmatimonadota bacterium]
MSLARNALLRASRNQWLARQMSQRTFARRAVRRFMPGEELNDALLAAAELSTSRIGSIITRLGETLTGERNPAEVRDHYLAALDEVRSRRLPTQLSIKPTQLALDETVAECVDNVMAIAARAGETGNYLWIDMEDSTYVDRTIELYERVRSRHERIGLCLQAYLYRTPSDLDRLLALKPSIRLVKGAYAEPATVAFPAKKDTDTQYVKLAETLLEAAAERRALPVFGTHDMNIVNRIVGRAESMNIPAGGYEVHMLYGIHGTDQRALAARDVGVRCLISYGRHWFPWYMRRLAERPANLWFVVKSTFA